MNSIMLSLNTLYEMNENHILVYILAHAELHYKLNSTKKRSVPMARKRSFYWVLVTR